MLLRITLERSHQNIIMSRNNIFDCFESNYKDAPNKTALIINDKSFSYQALYKDVKTLSCHLSKMGVIKGSNVVLFANNTIEFAVILLSCVYLGASITPLPLTLKGEGQLKALKYIKDPFIIGWFSVVDSILSSKLNLKNKCISLGRKIDNCYFYNDLMLEKKPLFEIDYDVSDDVNYIITMTSGSTGNPKPIVFTQATKLNRIFKATKDFYDLGDNEVVLVSTPLYHSLAQRSLLLPLLIGGTAVVLSKFNVKKWLDSVEKYQVSFLFAVSSQLESIANELEEDGYYQFNQLKTIVSSSALLKQNIKEKLLKVFNCDIHECYGASEVGVVSNFKMDKNSDKLGSVGKALPFVNIKIIDGEIVCKTNTIFKGYLKDNQTIDKGLDKEGYFHTGDLGYLDEDGYLYYQGRTKELIITGGINVYPSDIESVLNAIDGVQESAVIGVEDEHFGEVVCAIVQIDEKTCINDIKQVCLAKLIDYQQPRVYKIVDEFPRSALGKIMKKELQ